MYKNIVLLAAALSIMLSVYNIYNVNRRHQELDELMKAQLNKMVQSHFIGCARVSLLFDYCRDLSEQYREQLKKDVGL